MQWLDSSKSNTHIFCSVTIRRTESMTKDLNVGRENDGYKVNWIEPLRIGSVKNIGGFFCEYGHVP